MEALFAGLTPAQHLDPKVVAAKFNWFYHTVGDAKSYIALREQQGTDNNFSDEDSTMQLAEALIVVGERERALALVRPMLERLKGRCATDPANMLLLSSLSYAYALAGDHDAAVAAVDRILASIKSGDTLRKTFFLNANAAIVLAWAGEKDRAVDLFLPLMSMPSQVTSSIEALRTDIDFYPMRGFPRWEAMLADPAHRQPFKY